MTTKTKEVKASLVLNVTALVNERIIADLMAEPGTIEVTPKDFNDGYLIYEVLYEEDTNEN